MLPDPAWREPSAPAGVYLHADVLYLHERKGESIFSLRVGVWMDGGCV